MEASPIIVVFGGAMTTHDDMRPVMAFLHGVFPASTAFVYAPLSDGAMDGWWAPYAPREDELSWFRAKGASEMQAERYAYEWTREACTS